ncbi:hypothetical protein [Pelagibacterium lentulum]|uniref:Uncharacterized protein n=1 Tax=Pelagibacterium lentulum TaxID=2029865 RepID=A0A916RF65_9HYPH|nr:hypothetical protein [Pelagibacterium lentulum]GGA51807.1 hypothetical protein GCM10011499_22300 [Pelagibacterium lentulum]
MTTEYQVHTHRFIGPDEMNRLNKAKALEVIDEEHTCTPGMNRRVVRLPDGTLWRGLYDIKYLTFEPVEPVEVTVKKWRSLNH